MYKAFIFTNNSFASQNIILRSENIMLDKIALLLVIIGAVNWGAIGLFQFDLVAWIFGGQSGIVSRIIYTVVALAGIWCISLLFRDNEVLVRHEE
jgi:uncharacterized membrane protein YuzA (DUF378 family)